MIKKWDESITKTLDEFQKNKGKPRYTLKTLQGTTENGIFENGH